jgi:type I restriction enzyme R subunit
VELELTLDDEINVVYILKLLAKLKTGSPAQREKIKKEIVDLLTSELQLRSKRELIEKFINQNLPHIDDVDHIPEAFETFMSEEKQQALQQLSQEEKLSPEKLNEVIGNYIFTERKPLPDDIVNMLHVKPKILERKTVVQRITDKILGFVETFINGMGQ